MKFSQASTLLLFGACDAFAPGKFSGRLNTARSLAIDSSVLQDIPNHVKSLQDAFSSISLSDAIDALPEPSAVAEAVQQAAPDAADAVVEEANSSGFMGFLTGPIGYLLQGVHSLLVSAGVNENAWGVSIIFMTLVIKLLTFPLTKTQIESTNRMQAVQPAMKELQAKYQSNPEVMNQKIAELYQTNDINPLAGCLPALVQIPVFIGLYRSLLDLAKTNRLDEPFLFLPSLEGPVTDPTEGASWLFTGSLGTEDTIAFCILPILLVISQFISTELMQPKNQSPEQQQSNLILKFLPLMIGWFSLCAPCALSIYWFTNTVVTTATTVFLRNSMKMEPISVGGASAVAAPPQTTEIFAPPPLREKPAGFSDGVKPITGAVDVEVEAVEDVSEEETGVPIQEVSQAPKKSKKRGKKKKRRKN